MIVIPPDLLARFESTLTKKSVPNQLRNYYKKWLRFYLDFCQKNKQPISAKESLKHFIKKLNGNLHNLKEGFYGKNRMFYLLEFLSCSCVNPFVA